VSVPSFSQHDTHNTNSLRTWITTPTNYGQVIILGSGYNCHFLIFITVFLYCEFRITELPHEISSQRRINTKEPIEFDIVSLAKAPCNRVPAQLLNCSSYRTMTPTWALRHFEVTVSNRLSVTIFEDHLRIKVVSWKRLK